MNVSYQGKTHTVAYDRFLGDPTLYGLTSNFPGGSVFPAKKRDCRPVSSYASPATPTSWSPPSAVGMVTGCGSCDTLATGSMPSRLSGSEAG